MTMSNMPRFMVVVLDHWDSMKIGEWRIMFAPPPISDKYWEKWWCKQNMWGIDNWHVAKKDHQSIIMDGWATSPYDPEDHHEYAMLLVVSIV